MTDQPVTVEELDPDAAAAILDRRARSLLGMTGYEFTTAYRNRKLPAGAPHCVVENLATLLPADDSERLLRGRIAAEIEAAAHPCQEDDGAYCACADLQRKQDARIARGAQ